MDEKQRLRSPRYPSFSLVEAEDMARKIFAKDGLNPVDRESAVQHLGYKTINGASATALAALKQYGLVSDSGRGTFRLSNLALDLLEPENEPARAVAVQTAASTPSLFAALFEKFPTTIPSESNLRAHLLRQQFSSSAIKTVAAAYLATCEYVASAKSFIETGPAISTVTEEADVVRIATGPTVPSSVNLSPTLTLGDHSRNNRRMIFDTEEGEVIFTYPDSLSVESVDDVEEWFALVIKRLRRTTR